MTRKLLTAVALAAGALLWTSAANADEIGISGASGSITFTSGGPGNPITFTTAGFTAAAPLATFQSPNGTLLSSGSAVFGAMSGTAGPEVANLFPITSGAVESFSYTASPAGDALTGTVTWPDIKDGTTTPSFDVNAVLNILTVAATSSSIFKKDFQVGGTAQIDFTLTSGTPIATLATLAGDPIGTTTTFGFSSGEVVPTPEPASLTLLGSALIGLGWFGRCRRTTA